MQYILTTQEPEFYQITEAAMLPSNPLCSIIQNLNNI